MASVTLIICTLDRSEALSDLLRDLVDETPVDAQLIIVDQSSPDHISKNKANIQAFPRSIEHVFLFPPSLPKARNIGLHLSNSPITIFLDDDVRVLTHAIAELVASFQVPEIVGATSRILEMMNKPNRKHLCNEVGWDGRVHTCLDSTTSGVLGSMKGASMAVRTEIARKVGGFDEAFTGNALLEEADFSERIRAFGILKFVPSSVIVHRSISIGGVRSTPELDSRYQNTGRFLAKHRWFWWPAAVVFAGLALRDGFYDRDVSTSLRRGRAFWNGFQKAKQ